jgi:uncharacterized protein
MQSIIGTLIYYHYGLGLMTRIGYLPGLGVTMAVFALQIPLSRWWLSRFRFGPAEWLWRTLTYAKPQPMKKLEQKAAEAS